MSKFNENISKNKDEKSSNLIIISKARKLSAKERVNFITLKEGDLKLTLKLDNANLNKKQINNAVKSMKKQILINSKSYASLNEDSKLKSYLKKRNILQSPKNEIDTNSRQSLNLKKNQIINSETTRSYNELKTTENNKIRNKEDQNKLETIIPYEITTQENLKITENISLKVKSEEINEKNSDNDNIENMEIKIKEENNNENLNIKMNINENKLIDNGLISRDYFNNSKNKNLKINDIIFDKYKSEEIKKLNSNSTRNNAYINVKNNNFVEKTIQKSDRAIKSYNSEQDQEQEIDNKTKKSKLLFDSSRADIETNNKIKRLITEYDEINEKNGEKDLINERNSQSKSSKTIKVDEDDEESEEEENKKDKNNLITSSNFNTLIIKKENNKENFSKIKDGFDENKRIENSQNLKQINSLPIKQINYIYKACSICEHAYPISRLFCAECQIHFLCKKCSKNYYEDIIENGYKEMLCPFTKCRRPVDIEDLQNIISKEHYNILINKINNLKETQTKFYKTKLKSTFNQENMELYTKKHVIDINSNKKIYEFNNLKDVYCPNCFKETLFSRTNTYFFKCLNCECKRCKYCLKNYNERHMDTTYPDHCKIFYRADDDDFFPDSKKCQKIFLQIFFIFASYYLCFAGSFLFIRNIFFSFFRIKYNNNIFLSIFAYLFTIIFFIIVIPFIFFFYPYFPMIMALSDY